MSVTSVTALVWAVCGILAYGMIVDFFAERGEPYGHRGFALVVAVSGLAGLAAVLTSPIGLHRGWRF